MRWSKSAHVTGPTGRVGLVALLAVTGSLGGIAAPGRASDNVSTAISERCRTLTLIDYAKPLRKMKPLPDVPLGRVRLDGLAGRFSTIGGRVRVGSGKIGFRLRLRGRRSGQRGKLTFDSNISLVKRTGDVARIVERRVKTISTSRAARKQHVNLGFHVNSRPAAYRAQTRVLNSSGHVLANVAEYFRVVAKQGRARLSVQRTRLEPGEWLTSIVENLGTRNVMFGRDLAVDRFRGGSWQLDPLSPEGFVAVGLTIGGGRGYMCRELRLPPDAADGHYRIRKTATVVVA